MDLMENLAWMDFTWICVMYCFIFKPNQRGSVTGKKGRSFLDSSKEKQLFNEMQFTW